LLLGRLSLDLSVAELRRLATRDGASLNLSPTSSIEEFFTALGAQFVDSLDVSRFEGASICHDLNEPIPDTLSCRYDLVIDAGTLEHIFDCRAALRNIYYLLREGGVVVHSLPANGQLEHGFYQFSPTFLQDYLAANQWQIIKSLVLQYSSVHSRRWTIMQYEPAVFAARGVGAWSSRPMGLWFVARKTSITSPDCIPQQSYYLRAWGQDDLDASEPKARYRWNRRVPRSPKVRRLAKTIPYLSQLVTTRWARRIRWRLNVVDRSF